MSLLDVVIYDLDADRVETFAGRSLGLRVASTKLVEVGPRLPETQSVCSVPAGLYHVGDRLAAEDVP